MSSGNTYLEGSTVKLQATFKVAGVATDPTTVTLKVQNVDGTTSTYTYALGQVSKSATGVYYKNVTPGAVTSRTELVYRWEGTGDAAGVAEDTIKITPSGIA